MRFIIPLLNRLLITVLVLSFSHLAVATPAKSWRTTPQGDYGLFQDADANGDALFLVPGNEAVVACSQSLEEQGFDVRPIRRPTVAVGSERLRICLHRHNSLTEIETLLKALA